MKYKEIYLLVFSVVFLLLANSLNKYVKTTNYVDTFQDIDSKGYIYNADRFYKHGVFVTKNDTNVPYFSLGYPAFIGSVYKYFNNADNNDVIWIQIFLALISCFFIFYTTNIIFGSSVAVVAFILSSINIGFITFSNFILTESLLTFFLSLFLYLFVLFLHKKKLVYVLFAGLILGISIFIKPAAIYFILPVILLISYLGNKKKFKAIILFSIAFYLPVISYMYYNKVNFGNFSVATLGDENLYFYLFPKVLALQNDSDVKMEQEMLGGMLTGSKLDPKSWDNLKEKFNQNFKNNTGLFVAVWLKNVMKTFLGLYTTNLKVLTDSDVKGGDLSFFKTTGSLLDRAMKYITSGTNLLTIKLIGMYEAFWTLFRYLLVLFGLGFLFVKKDFKTLFFLLFYIFYFSMITGHDGCARFRMMFEPVLIMLSAQGFFVVYYRFRPIFAKYMTSQV